MSTRRPIQPRSEDEIAADLQLLQSYVLELAGGVPPARVGDPNAGQDELAATAEQVGMGPDQLGCRAGGRRARLAAASRPPSRGP